ncbi:MAG: sulfotransferase [Woeseiaceae bacterium]|nr:sulfotransferase [Woeseiaceae bacterium]
MRSGDHQTALTISNRLLDEFEESPETLLLAGEVHFSRGNFVRAEKLAIRCSENFPHDFSGPVLRCRALLALGRIGEARDLALNLSTQSISEEAHFEILVTVLSGCLEPQAAYALCRKSIELDRYNPAAHRRLALACRLIGRLDEALEAAEIAIRFNAHDYEMLGLRSVLRRATGDNNHLAELEALLASGCRTALGATRVCYALAKECEELGLHERAFEYLQTGANYKRSTLRFEIDSELQTLQFIQEYHTASAFHEEMAGFDSNEPIFIVGLPRTGSTLIERILSSHSAVHAAGELLHLNAAMMQEVRKLGPLVDHADLVRKSIKADPAAIGRNYIERTRPFTGHTPHFIDKRTQNYLSLGVIHRALPKAGIVHVRRAPMDTCFAIYKFLFNDAYPWSYDLDEIAQYYVAYRRLMDHWRAVLPGRIIDVTYEDVVTNLEGETRRLLDRLGLDWQPECLNFHESEAATMTGSAVQVRQPVYSSSVGRWRDYERQLQKVAETLTSAGIDPYNP